jgi:hypothetical protein
VQRLGVQRLGVQRLGVQRLGVQRLGVQRLGVQRLGVHTMQGARYRVHDTKHRTNRKIFSMPANKQKRRT